MHTPPFRCPQRKELLNTVFRFRGHMGFEDTVIEFWKDHVLVMWSEDCIEPGQKISRRYVRQLERGNYGPCVTHAILAFKQAWEKQHDPDPQNVQ